MAPELLEITPPPAAPEIGIEKDGPHHECGIFGIYAPGLPVGIIGYRAGEALEHRGHSGSGEAHNDPTTGEIVINKGIGRMEQAMPGSMNPAQTPYITATEAEVLGSHILINHKRYSTNENDDISGVHPHRGIRTGVVSAHNGEFIRLRLEYLAKRRSLPMRPGLGDSALANDIIDYEIARAEQKQEVTTDVLGRTLERTFAQLDGAYCITMIYKNKLIITRDPNGIHPLSLGKLKDGAGYVAASEKLAFQHQEDVELDQTPYIDAGGYLRYGDNIRDVQPGEILIIDEEGLHQFWNPRPSEAAHCVFEHIYTAGEDETINGAPNWLARYNMGLELGIAAPVDADMVIGVPKSGLPAARGFAEASATPYVNALTINPNYSGVRSFLLRGDARERVLEGKFLLNEEAVEKFLRNVFDVAASEEEAEFLLEEIERGENGLGLLEGLRVVVVDDSGIKGNVMRRVIRLLQHAEPAEIHVRFASPRYEHSCAYGMDTSNESEFIAREGRPLSAIAHDLGATTVAYNTIEDVEQAVNNAKISAEVAKGTVTPSLLGKFCRKCSMGESPMKLPEHLQPVAAELGDLALEHQLALAV